MLQPTWLVDTLAGIMLVTATYCFARLVAARRWGRTLHQDVNIAHMADAVAMAGMLVAAFRTLSNGAWEIVFGAMILWFASRGARLVVRHGIGGMDDDHRHHVSHYLSHLVMSAGMLYMFLETSSPAAGSVAYRAGIMPGMGVPGTARSNTGILALLFVLVLFASAVWHADSLTRFTTARRALVGVGAPAVTRSLSTLSSGTDHEPLSTEVSQERDPTNGTPEAEPSHWLAPRLEMGCHIAVCITMGYMLVLLL